jgi:hypothetical protein
MDTNEKIIALGLIGQRVDALLEEAGTIRRELGEALAKYKVGQVIEIVDGRSIKRCKVFSTTYAPRNLSKEPGDDPILYRVQPIKADGTNSKRFRSFVLKSYHKIKE